jgi:hypothetical protein
VLRIERHTLGRWVTAYEPTCSYQWRQPLLIPAGDDYTDVAEVRAVQGAAPDWSAPAVEGIYRAVYALHYEPPEGSGAQLLPIAQRTSDPFTIEMKP